MDLYNYEGFYTCSELRILKKKGGEGNGIPKKKSYFTEFICLGHLLPYCLWAEVGGSPKVGLRRYALQLMLELWRTGRGKAFEPLPTLVLGRRGHLL